MCIRDSSAYCAYIMITAMKNRIVCNCNNYLSKQKAIFSPILYNDDGIKRKKRRKKLIERRSNLKKKKKKLKWFHEKKLAVLLKSILQMHSGGGTKSGLEGILFLEASKAFQAKFSFSSAKAKCLGWLGQDPARFWYSLTHHLLYTRHTVCTSVCV